MILLFIGVFYLFSCGSSKLIKNEKNHISVNKEYFYFGKGHFSIGLTLDNIDKTYNYEVRDDVWVYFSQGNYNVVGDSIELNCIMNCIRPKLHISSPIFLEDYCKELDSEKIIFLTSAGDTLVNVYETNIEIDNNLVKNCSKIVSIYDKKRGVKHSFPVKNCSNNCYTVIFPILLDYYDHLFFEEKKVVFYNKNSLLLSRDLLLKKGLIYGD